MVRRGWNPLSTITRKASRTAAEPEASSSKPGALPIREMESMWPPITTISSDAEVPSTRAMTDFWGKGCETCWTVALMVELAATSWYCSNSQFADSSPSSLRNIRVG
eukprot:Lithocolla_globosa_v1_NODE_5515_length_1227_cov_68.407502.p2 type:complete len:107 gc:universal NODE_5515_length_1227_cov_68.407502:525-845(+)